MAACHSLRSDTFCHALAVMRWRAGFTGDAACAILMPQQGGQHMGIGPHPHGSAHQKKDGDMTPLFDGKSDAELLAIFEPMMDNCLAGSSAIDHAQHVRDFTERLAAIVTRKSRGAMR